MSIVNRRNAILGWGVWKLAKRAVRRRLRELPPFSWGLRARRSLG